MSAPLDILYPNGLVLAVQTFVISTVTGHPTPWDGSVTGGGGGGGGAVTIANGADVAQGSTGDAAWTTGAGSVIAILKNIANKPGGAVTNDGTFATPALQTAGNNSLASIDSKLTNPLPVSGTVSVTGSVGVTGTINATILSGVITTITNPVSVTGSVNATITGGTISATIINGTVSITGGVNATITSGVITTVSNITNPVTVISTTGTLMHVNVDNSPTITNDGTFATPALQTTGNNFLSSVASTLSSILANQIVPLGGPQAIAQNAYWVTHRLDELNLIENMKQTWESILLNESESSQRMGFELR